MCNWASWATPRHPGHPSRPISRRPKLVLLPRGCLNNSDTSANSYIIVVKGAPWARMEQVELHFRKSWHGSVYFIKVYHRRLGVRSEELKFSGFYFKRISNSWRYETFFKIWIYYFKKRLSHSHEQSSVKSDGRSQSGKWEWTTTFFFFISNNKKFIILVFCISASMYEVCRPT